MAKKKKAKKAKKRTKARPKKKAKKRMKKARSKKRTKKVRPRSAARRAKKKAGKKAKAKKAKPKAKAKKKVKKVVKEVEIGKVTHFYGHIEVGIVKLSKPVKKGDKLHFKGATSNFTQKVGSMQVDHADIAVAKKGDEIGLKVNKKVREGDTVYFAK